MAARWTKRYAKQFGMFKVFLDVSQYWQMRIFNKRIVGTESPAFKRSNPARLESYGRVGACKLVKGEYHPLDPKKSNSQEKKELASAEVEKWFKGILPTMHDFNENPESWEMVGEV